MRRIVYGVSCCMMLFVSCAFARIDIGDEIKVQNVSFENFDNAIDVYTDRRSYTMQRTRVYIEGEIQQDVIARVQIQSLGMWGTEQSTATVRYNGYTYSNFTPWVEQAFLSLKNVLDSFPIHIPLDIMVGKQPLKYGDGFIINDDQRGLYALRVNAQLPFQFGLELFDVPVFDGDYNTQYTTSTTQYNSNASVQGALLSWQRWGSVFLPTIYGILEKDNSRMRIPDGVSNKIFYGTRFEGKTKERLFYRLEAMYQTGSETNDIPSASFDYSGYAFVIGASARSYASTFGDTIIRAEYGYGTGDKARNYDGQYLTRSGFSPLLAGRNQEPGQTYFGEIFSLKYPGLTDKRVALLGLDSNPFKSLHVIFNYLFYAKQNSTGQAYGEEVDTILLLTHAKTVTIRFVYAFLFPGEAITGTGVKGYDIKHTKLEIQYTF